MQKTSPHLLVRVVFESSCHGKNIQINCEQALQKFICQLLVFGIKSEESRKEKNSFSSLFCQRGGVFFQKKSCESKEIGNE